MIFLNGNKNNLTDSHHYHHGHKPTMVGICHSGNMPVSHGHHHCGCHGRHGHQDTQDKQDRQDNKDTGQTGQISQR